MKKVCSSCGETFEGVICPNCNSTGGRSSDRTTIITVSRPVFEEDPLPPASEVSDRDLQTLARTQKKAQRAEKRVKSLEEREERRNRSSARRENRLLQSEQSDSAFRKTLSQLRHVLSLSISGATRQAIHFVISPRGGLSFILLIPLCLLLPIIIAISCTAYSGVDTSPDFLTAVWQVLAASAPAMLRAILFWLELCGAMVLYLRAHAFAINSAMTLRSAVGLVCVSQLPALYLTPLFAACLFIVPSISLLLAVLAVFQFIIMVFVGVEFAAMDKKRGVFASFSIMLGAYICTAAAISAINFPAASDYIITLISKVYI